MGYLNYRRKHTASYSHYHTVRERWADFKVRMTYFWVGVAVGAVVVMVIMGSK